MFLTRILKFKRPILVPPLLGILSVSVLVAQTPSSAISHFKVGVKENKEGNFDRAIEEFTIAIEINSHPVPHRAGEQARSLHFAGKAELDSTEETESIIVLDKFTGLAYAHRCFARVHKRDFARAIADCDQALRITPRLAQDYQNRGVARQIVGDTNGALIDFNKAIEIDANLVEAWVGRGA
jgi:tetratricopeptide (TPR) repeat protein